MSAASERAIKWTLGHECGGDADCYSNIAADRGGPTRWGISERFARAKGYTGPMQALPLDLALRWYEGSIWARYRFEEVAQYSWHCAAYLYDMAVNHGKWTRVAQEAVSVYESIKIDGLWGKDTHAAFVKLASQRPRAFLAELRVSRCRYIASPAVYQPEFIKGWLRRCVALLT